MQKYKKLTSDQAGALTNNGSDHHHEWRFNVLICLGLELKMHLEYKATFAGS